MTKPITSTEAGSIPYKIINNEPQYLLVYREKFKDYSFPKGHQEQGESLQETCLRETFEEVGVRGNIINELGNYSYNFTTPNKADPELTLSISVKVNLFLLEVTEELSYTNIVEEGKTNRVWCSYEQVKELLTYPEVLDLFDDAHSFIKEH